MTADSAQIQQFNRKERKERRGKNLAAGSLSPFTREVKVSTRVQTQNVYLFEFFALSAVPFVVRDVVGRPNPSAFFRFRRRWTSDRHPGGSGAELNH